MRPECEPSSRAVCQPGCSVGGLAALPAPALARNSRPRTGPQAACAFRCPGELAGRGGSSCAPGFTSGEDPAGRRCAWAAVRCRPDGLWPRPRPPPRAGPSRDLPHSPPPARAHAGLRGCCGPWSWLSRSPRAPQGTSAWSLQKSTPPPSRGSPGHTEGETGLEPEPVHTCSRWLWAEAAEHA